MLASGPRLRHWPLQQAGEVGGGITTPAMCGGDPTICCLCFTQMPEEGDSVILCTVEVKSMSPQTVEEWDNNPVQSSSHGSNTFLIQVFR